MNIVLLSGGSGKRLWPLSNDVRSKQFIKIFRTEDGNYESMVQRVCRQIRKADPSASVTIATSKTQVSSIHNQLGEGVDISVEPCRRDTFPAIALAASYLADVKGIDPREVVVVCPVDPYVEDDYFEALKKLEKLAAEGKSNLVLMGIEPTYPSEKYGYIIPESGEKIASVSTFKEKPDARTAAEYIQKGALWNGGVFAFQLQFVLDKAHELMDFTDYHDLFARYDTLRSISFDYAVVEQEKEIQVLRFSGEWKDLGTWNTLTEAWQTRQSVRYATPSPSRLSEKNMQGCSLRMPSTLARKNISHHTGKSILNWPGPKPVPEPVPFRGINIRKACSPEHTGKR